MIVPSDYYNRFNKINEIQYGPYQTDVECLGHHKDQHTIYISSQLKSKLNISKNKNLTIQIRNQSCTILLMMGVFIAGFESDDRLLGTRSDLYKTMSKAGENLGFQTIFFGYQHIISDKRKIHAFHLHKNKWIQDSFDFPTVIYNRLPNRKIEHHPEVVKKKKLLEQESYLFNHGFFNKWEVYELLMRNPDTSYLLPETILHPSRQKINKLLNETSLYIKPIHGSRGDGIVKCKKLATGEVECHYYYNDKPQINRYTKIESFLNQQFPNGLKGYVVQKEIILLKKGKSSIDFRVHANKNHRNSWEIPLICAKFAGKGSLTTHVQRGGSIHTIDELFTEDQTKKITRKLTTTALSVSQNMEKYITFPFGEIGFDFGIDEEGKVWLFEANAKPGYSVFDHHKLEQQAIEVLSYPFKYAFYLDSYKRNNRDQ